MFARVHTRDPNLLVSILLPLFHAPRRTVENNRRTDALIKFHTWYSNGVIPNLNPGVRYCSRKKTNLLVDTNTSTSCTTITGARTSVTKNFATESKRRAITRLSCQTAGCNMFNTGRMRPDITLPSHIIPCTRSTNSEEYYRSDLGE